MTRLVSVGNVVIDLVLRLPALPERGADVLARSQGEAPGGSFNTMVAATRQGLPSAYAGGHGTGPFGDRVRAALVAEGIGVLQAATQGVDTGYDIALVDDEGERTFVTVFGAEAQLTSLPPVGDDDLVQVSGYGLLDETNADVLAPWVRDCGGSVVLFDPGPLVADIRPEVLDEVRHRADWLSCSLREALTLSGETDAAAAAHALSVGWRGVVVRLGPEGCLVDGELAAGFPTEVVDTNGAGDAHVGAFLAALASGATPIAAARRANACAALAVSRPGPASSPTAAEVDALLS